MKLKGSSFFWISVAFTMSLIAPFTAFSDQFSITAINPFPEPIYVSSITTATYQITNIAKKMTLTAINLSEFPKESGLSLVLSTCGNPMRPGEYCKIQLQLKAPDAPQTIKALLKEWAKPTLDIVKYPLLLTVIQHPQFTITPVAGSGGSISPNTPQSVINGSNLTFTATPAENFTINTWLLDGGIVQTGGNSYTLSNITANHTVTVTFTASISVAVGLSLNQTGIKQLPLAYMSNDGGSNFNLSSALVLPSGQTFGKLLNVTCAEKTCISVGSSFTAAPRGYNNFLPLVYTSADDGKNWNLSHPLTVPTGRQAELAGTSCANNGCTAVGYSYVTQDEGLFPLAYTSTDKGMNWTVSKPIPLPIGQGNGSLSSVACVDNKCTAVGKSIGFNILPVAYVSNNGGKDWLLASPLPRPVGPNLAQLNSVTCLSRNCVAVGNSYYDAGGNFPLSYVSNDGGCNWDLTSPFSLPPGRSEGKLEDVSCIDNLCITVGSSFNGNDFLPLGYISQDGGRHWQLIPPFVLPNGQTFGLLSSITCFGNTCIAVGESNGSNQPLPLAYKSIDSGRTWTLTTSLPQPSGQNFGKLLAIANG